MKLNVKTIIETNVFIEEAFTESFEDVFGEFADQQGGQYCDIDKRIVTGTMSDNDIEKLAEHIEYTFEDGWLGIVRISKTDCTIPNLQDIDALKKFFGKIDNQIWEDNDDLGLEKVQVESYYIYAIGKPM